MRLREMGGVQRELVNSFGRFWTVMSLEVHRQERRGEFGRYDIGGALVKKEEENLWKRSSTTLGVSEDRPMVGVLVTTSTQLSEIDEDDENPETRFENIRH